MKTFRRTSNIVFGIPWATTPQCFETIAAIFQRHLDGAQIPNVRSEIVTADDAGNPMIRRVGASDVIRIHGPILPRASMGNLSSTVTGSAELSAAIKEAAASDSRAIVLDVDSPGGSVLGGMECSDIIFAAKETKPVIACVSGYCASLAYLFASQASEIYASRGSEIGSIGVIARLQSDERAALNEGIDSITVASSRKKAMHDLSTGEIRAALQSDVEKYFGMMKETINRGRPGLVADAESFPEMLGAVAAMDAKLIDGIATLDEVLTSLEKIV